MKPQSKNYFLKSVSALCGVALMVSACKKNDDNEQSGPSKQMMAQIAAQDIQRSNMLSNSFALGFQGANQSTQQKNPEGRMASSCVAFTIFPADFTTYPKTLTYDFGNGCIDDNKNKKGKIILSVGTPWKSDSYIAASFLNYSENYNKLDGTYKLTNKSTSDGIFLTFEANNITLTDSSGKAFIYNIVQNYKQIAGNKTWQIEDDIYEITGSASTVLSDGQKLSWLIVNPLIKTNSCGWVQSGKGIFTLNSKNINVDYGNGTCDNKATIQIDDYITEVTLR